MNITKIRWVEVKLEYRDGEYTEGTSNTETLICGLLDREPTEEEDWEDIWYFKNEEELEYHKQFRNFGEKGGYAHFKVLSWSYFNI